MPYTNVQHMGVLQVMYAFAIQEGSNPDKAWCQPWWCQLQHCKAACHALRLHMSDRQSRNGIRPVAQMMNRPNDALQCVGYGIGLEGQQGGTTIQIIQIARALRSDQSLMKQRRITNT